MFQRIEKMQEEKIKENMLKCLSKQAFLGERVFLFFSFKSSKTKMKCLLFYSHLIFFTVVVAHVHFRENNFFSQFLKGNVKLHFALNSVST